MGRRIFISSFLRILDIWLGLNISYLIGKDINHKVFSNILNQDYKFFINELERVSSKGYIELPTKLEDNLVFENKRDHLWQLGGGALFEESMALVIGGYVLRRSHLGNTYIYIYIDRK